jgi:hypothetical protein
VGKIAMHSGAFHSWPFGDFAHACAVRVGIALTRRQNSRSRTGAMPTLQGFGAAR